MPTTNLKVTQEKLPESQVSLEIEIPAAMADKAYEQIVRKFMRDANIPGFRRGKVPRQVILQRFGAAQLRAAALEDLIDDALQQAIKQEDIDAIGNYQLKTTFDDLIAQYQPGANLTFIASVDVPPTVTLKDYKGLTAKAEESPYKPEDVDKVIEDYRDQVATLVPVEDRPAQLKDIAVVDFRGVLPSDDPDAEPEEFAGNEAQDFEVELDTERFIAGFVDGIVGMQSGETKEIATRFPDEYPQEDLAGRDVVFTVTLKELKEKELPELDDDFAQEVSEFETLAEFRESLEKEFQSEAERVTRKNQEDAILEVLVQQLDAEIPETLVEREVVSMLNQTAMQLQRQGMDVRQIFTEENVPQLKESARPEAIARLQRTLALGEVAKQEAIAVTAEELAARVEEVLKDLEDTSGIDQEQLKEVLEEEMLQTKIMDWLLENSTIELVPEGTLQAEEDPDETATAAATTAPAEAATPDAATATVDTTATPVADPAAETPQTEDPEAPPAKKTKAKKTKKTTKSEDSPKSESATTDESA